jgi:hypothetical protein
MKKIFALILLIFTMFSLCAGLCSCDGNDEENSKPTIETEGGGVGFEEIV